MNEIHATLSSTPCPIFLTLNRPGSSPRELPGRCARRGRPGESDVVRDHSTPRWAARAPRHPGARHRAGRRLPADGVPHRQRARARRHACATTPTACGSRSRARPPSSTLFVERLGRRSPGAGAASGRSSTSSTIELAVAGELAFRVDPRAGRPPGRARPRHRPARRRDLRRLPARARSIRDDRRYRYPFINCTGVRPALHHRARRALRPRAHDDGARSRCAPRAAPSTTTRATAASTPSPTPARRCGPRARVRATAPARSTATTALARRGRRARAGRDRRGQGRSAASTLAVRRDATSRRWRGCARASAARTSRSR